MITQDLDQISPWGNKIVRAIGKVNLWLAAIGFAFLFLHIWGYYEMLSIVPSHLSPETSKIIRIEFRSQWITSGVLLFAQGYTGWRMLRHRGARGITAAMVVFCGLVLYFLLVTCIGLWGSGIIQTLALGQPWIVLDWEMLTGYPAAAAILLHWVKKNAVEAQP